MIENKASDLHITAGVPPMLRVDGVIKKMSHAVITPEVSKQIAYSVLTEEQQKLLQDLTDGNCITPRDSKEYQHLLFSEEDSHADNTPDDQQDNDEQSKDENDDTQK